MKYKITFQRDTKDCGPACLHMISDFYGIKLDLEQLREDCYLGRNGVSLLNIKKAAEKIGFKTLAIKANIEELIDSVPFPCILYWKQNHFVLLYDHIEKGLLYNEKFVVADPGHGIVKLERNDFLTGWLDENTSEKGVILTLEPPPDIKKNQPTEEYKINKKRKNFSFLWSYLKRFKSYLYQLLVSMGIESFINLIFPILTQQIVDYGIGNSNLSFISNILLFQIFFFLGQISVQLIRNWILLHTNTMISISIISDFLIKLMKLPMSFFDNRSFGDLVQRIQDHNRIEQFLTGTSLNTIFSALNLVIFSFIILLYSFHIFLLFFFGSLLSIFWLLFFMSKRKEIDYKKFLQMRQNQDSIIEIIHGMPEIKLYNAESTKREKWERIQQKLFKLNISSLSLTQYQETGSTLITYLKNILITFITATSVVKGDLTLGMMLSISYIIGQMNAPLDQLLRFVTTLQDARLSLERLAEVHSLEDEKKAGDKGKITSIFGNIKIENLNFRYTENPADPLILKNLDLLIPENKVTAIVGESGSGKTTLMKVLLGFYKPSSGNVFIGDDNLSDIAPGDWRSFCGSVLQDGYIFGDSISNNICMIDNCNDESIDLSLNAVNLKSFVEKLPLKKDTVLGANGQGLSGGQRQRLLIARAIYKNPNYLFLDEATSSLDATNERVIVNNLKDFYIGKTVIIIAHRLSTVINADQIVVLNKGEIVERGDHSDLIKLKGVYYNLIKNQLELG